MKKRRKGWYWAEILKYVSAEECANQIHLVSLYMRSCVVRKFLAIGGGKLRPGLSMTKSLNDIKISLDPESDVDIAWRFHRIYNSLESDEHLFMQKYEAHIQTSSSSSSAFPLKSLRVPNVFNATESIRKWKGYHAWTGRDVEEEILERNFRCGETVDGEEILISMKDMFEYCLCCRDDTPIYIFDRDFANRHKSMLSEYDAKVIPEKYLGIKNNLLDLHDEKKCPPRRWLLVGPKGSGTDVHTDPRGTCAWNVLLRGKKLWFLADPSFSKDQVGEGTNPDDLPSSRWFMGNNLFELIRKYPGRIFLFLQREGDVVYVPPNYYHAVWNLDTLNVAVTENMITMSSFREDCYKGHHHKSNNALCDFVEEYYGLLDATQTREWLDRVLSLINE